VGNPNIFVAPRSQVPGNARLLLAPTQNDEALVELDASTHDFIDGLGSRCLAPGQALVFAQSELDRLALADWTVVSENRDDFAQILLRDGEIRQIGPCAQVKLDRDDRTVLVASDGGEDPERWESLDVAGNDVAAPVKALRDVLRTAITNRCVSLPTAQAMVTSALGDKHHWPLAAIEDFAASCTRVDLVVGGSIQITVHGPTTTTP